MVRCILVAAFAATWVEMPQETTKSGADSATTQPATKPVRRSGTLREPAQAEVLRKLLGRESRYQAILPQPPESKGERGISESRSPSTKAPALLLEGTTLVERPGRLLITGDRAEFAFYDDGGETLRTIEINKNGYLEVMERSAKAGVDEFIISAEVTRYRDKNYLNVLKVLRRVPNGNLGP